MSDILRRVTAGLGLGAGILGLMACTAGGGVTTTTTQPIVLIGAPTPGSTFVVGETVSVQSASADPAGITQVELIVDGQIQPGATAQNTAVSDQFSTVQPWTAAGVGAHTLTVRAHNSGGLTGEASVAISVTAQGSTPIAAATADAAAPTDAATPSATDSPRAAATTESGCIDNAVFTGAETIPAGTVVSPAASFVKTWEVQNTGSCAWGDGYVLARVGGEALGAGAEVAVGATAPGSKLTLAVGMVAPDTAGAHSSAWHLRSPNGVLFGPQLGVSINVAAPTVQATAVPPSLTPNPPTAQPTAQPTATPAALVYNPPFPGGAGVGADWSENGLYIDANAHDMRVGQDDGDGIAYIDIVVQDLDGNPIASKREMNKPYCFFGDHDGVCNTLEQGAGPFEWRPGVPIREGYYLVRATAYAPDGRALAAEEPLHINFPPDSLETLFVNFDAPNNTEVRRQLEYAASVEGEGTAAGIDRVQMDIVGYDGKVVYRHTERTPAYCGFGGGENGFPCNVFNFAENGFKFPGGAPIQRTLYLLRVVAYARDGNVAAQTLPIQITALE